MGPKFVYVIFPYDDDGKISSVYVGSAENARVRLDSHLYAKANDPYKDLHDQMKKNGFEFFVIDELNYSTSWREYMWAKYFHDCGRLKVFNKKFDHKNIPEDATAETWISKRLKELGKKK